MPAVMYEHDSDKAPVTYQDLSAYFSEEEWTLLHGWQKELYNKVMNEVHQALISLGPLIATAVNTLRTKEMKDGCTMDHQDSDIRHIIGGDHTFDIDKDLGPDHVFRPNGSVEEHNVEEEEGESSFIIGQEHVTPVSTHRMKEEVETCFLDNQGFNRTEIVDSFEDQADVIPVATLRIKEEAELYYVDNHDSDIMEIFDSSEDSGNLNMQQDHRKSVKSPEWKLPRKASSRRNSVRPVTEKPTQYESEMNEHYLHLTEEISFGNPSNFNLKPKSPIQDSAGKYDPYTIDKVNIQHITYEQQKLPTCLQQKCTTDMSPGYQKSIHQKKVYLGRQQRHMEDNPFKCTDCAKSFRWKSHLIRHQGTHCEAKPFQCSLCPKCFSRNDSLISHHRTHTGESPYKCNVCMKRFRHNSNLISHMATHTVN